MGASTEKDHGRLSCRHAWWWLSDHAFFKKETDEQSTAVVPALRKKTKPPENQNPRSDSHKPNFIQHS